MPNIIIHFFLFAFIIVSNGFIFFRLIFLKNLTINLFEFSILGMMVTGFLAQVINFFIPLSDLVIFFNLFTNIVILTIYKKKRFLNFNKYTVAILAAMLILCFSQIYGSGFSDDLAHYHGGQIINSDNSKYILGVNFLHHHYGYGSIWLLLHSYLNFNSTFLQDIHIVNAITLFFILSYFIVEFLGIKKDSNKNTLYIILSVFIFFFLIKYTRLKEFGLDRPGILFFCFLTYLSFKYRQITDAHRDSFVILTLIISLFLTSIKLFFIFSFLIPLFLIFNFKNFKFFLKLEFTFFLFLAFCYFGKNILWTGCLIYPLYFTCFSGISWNSQDIAYNLFSWTGAHTKGFDSYTGALSKAEYLANFQWIPTWFAIVSEELLTYLGISAFIIFVIFISSKSLKNIPKKNLWEKLFFGALFLVNLLIFFKVPVIRYQHTLFLFFIILFFTLVPKKFLFKQTFLYVIIIIFFSFNLGKNFKRIYKDNFFNNPIQHLKKIGWHREPQLKKLNEFTYYKGWIGAYPVGNESLDKYKYKKIFYDIIYK